MKYIKMNKIFTIITFFFAVITANAQDSIQHKNERIKVDGVAVVIGKNIVLDSDIEKFKKELQQRIEGKIEISDCEILEEIMTQKLIAHHAVVDSVVVTDDEIQGEVERNIGYFTQQLGTIEKVLKMYGFNDEEDLREELGNIQKEQILIKRERGRST